MLTKEAILAADDAGMEVVNVPEWGGDVYVRIMSGEQRDDFEQHIFQLNKDDRKRNLRALLVAFTACEENGTPLFNSEDIPALGRKSGRALDRIFTVAIKLNAISKQDQDELLKN